MNGTDRLTSDLPSPPVDALDGVIDGLKHVIPVFDERQPQRGVNTRYIWAFSSFLSSHAQNIALTTQNTRRKRIIPTTPKLSILKETAFKAATAKRARRAKRSSSSPRNPSPIWASPKPRSSAPSTACLPSSTNRALLSPST